MATLAQPGAAGPIGDARWGSQRRVHLLLLLSVLAVAVCGFVYELVIIAMGTYLFGNSVAQVSLVLGVFVSSMGLGSLLAKPMLRRPVEWFVGLEAVVALVGGSSAMVLYWAFAWLDLYQPMMIAVSVAIGLLVGCEIPLLMALMQRVREQEAGASLSNLLAADYLGAVIAGVAFPLVLLPHVGQVHAALGVGLVNGSIGVLVLVLFRRSLSRRSLLSFAALLTGAALVLCAAVVLAGRFVVTARQALYDDPIVHAERSSYQDIVLTSSAGSSDVRLFLNGDLQFSSADEYRYHESLVHPAMAGAHESVLVLGGGDGLAMREVLRYPGVERAVKVELDPAMTRLAREDPRLRALNGGSLADPRVEVVHADAFTWLRGNGEQFDVVVVDFPDPDDAATAKLYSAEIYSVIRSRALRPGGRMVVQAGSPFFAHQAFWCIERTLREAGLQTRPYHVDVPSFGDWGFVLAAEARPPVGVDPPSELRFLDAGVLEGASHFPADRARVDVKPSTLNAPTILEYERTGWRDY